MLTHFLETLNHLKLLRDAVAVAFNHSLRSIELESFLLNKVVYHLDALNVLDGIHPHVLGIALGLDNGKLLLPKAQGGGGDVKNLGDITYLVELFAQFIFHLQFNF